MSPIEPAVGDDDVGLHWMDLIAWEWHDELSDPRQDIYTLQDGLPVDTVPSAHLPR